MKYTNEILKSLPKVEVSFQDDFSGATREYTLTPNYILRELQKLGLEAKMGNEILLWEKDMNKEDKEYYLCNVGKVVKAQVSETIPEEERPRLNGTPIQIEIDRNGYFDLPFDNDVF